MTIPTYLLESLKFGSAIGCGLVAGIFFAFSTFVMLALARLEPPQGITAMQEINITVINPWFMLAFLGTAVTCLLLAIASVVQWQQPGSVYVLAGSLLYLVGTLLVTILGNVPLNDALAIAQPHTPEAADLWADYLSRWTFWNHVRTIAALVAAALLTISLYNRPV